MFENLEKYYKKNSQQIKFRKKVISIYLLIIVSFLIINSVTPGDPVVKTAIFLSLVIIITVLTAKISLLIITHNNKKHGVNDSIADKDYLLIRKYLRDRKLLRKEPLEIFKNHYLAKCSTQKLNYHTEILLTIVTIFTSFISGKDYASETITESIALSITVSIGLLVVYSIIKSSFDLYNFYTGTDDLYETLEDYTTRLYLNSL